LNYKYPANIWFSDEIEVMDVNGVYNKLHFYYKSYCFTIFCRLEPAWLLLFSLQKKKVNKKSRSKKAIAGHRSLHGQNAFSIACSGIFLYLGSAERTQKRATI